MARTLALFLASFLLICGATILFPGIDLWASGLFYRPGAGFFLGDWLPFRLIHSGMHELVAAIIIAGAALLIAALWRRRPVFGVDARAAVFLLLVLAIGPGLVVNTLFKDHWGRARPAQITAFGGDKRFTPPFVPSPECRRNCSFPAGDPAVGFYFVSAAFLLAAPWRRRAIGGALVLGAGIGIVRIAQGGHFLSDVIASGFFVTATSWLLYRWIMLGDGLGRLGRQLRRPSPALRYFTLLGIASAAAILVSITFLDRPLARAFHDGNPAIHRIFGIITRFGISTGWLIAALALALGFAIAARRSADAARARRFAGEAWRAFFVFTAVAGAGLAGDLLKPVFGRARPKLLFSEHLFAFTWHGGRADYWSFPSGHTITIVALAAALALVAPRGRWLYVAAALLVMASRIILAEHYLSDVIGGAFLALVAVWAIRAGFRRLGVSLEGERSP